MSRKKIEFHTMTIGDVRDWLQTNTPSTRQIKTISQDERAGVRKLIESYLREQKRLTVEAARQERMWSYERRAGEQGFLRVAGIDEAGRGPLAGPVVAAAVILPEQIDLPGLNDSKQVKENVRDQLYDLICAQAVAYGVGIVDVDYIDRHNILQGTFEASRRALAQLEAQFGLVPDYLLTDFLKIPGVTQPYEAIVKGDSSSYSIAAASILAKVTRDRLMVEYAAQYPQYGFARNKGYGSPDHLAALEEHGPCPLHRTSFAPVAQKLQLQGSLFDGFEF
ncbi:ribonuclease HII [Tumebacillus permanentifrigoris]|uniref:Ribonuclease HII n=1 Tax=Tumebacillus permanentifrigoris TaxID=378543 RepID=A0A316D843_9BACL|nr:ribonuclease HII [Tumebacillus permanentifrigoris]PWK12747.1 RNase HII [Tumebacillus permanentifrigoris]